MILPSQHPAAGETFHLPENHAARVGDARDPDRRPHIFHFAGLHIRTVPSAAEPVLQPFLTVAQVRRTMVTGAYRERRRSRPDLRTPDDIISPQHGFGEIACEALTFAEATVLTELVGGRLPTEREIDHILVHLPDQLRHAARGTAWTASIWSRFSYSLALWDLAAHAWRAPPVHDRGGDQTQPVACVQFDGTVRRMPAPSLDTPCARAWLVFDPSGRRP
jgi:hypothetical protein